MVTSIKKVATLNIQHCRRFQLTVINVQHSTLPTATIQHSTFNTQHCASRIIQHRLRRQFNTQHSTLNIAHSARLNIQHSTFNILFPHPTDGTRRAILRWGTLDSIIICVSNNLTTIT